MARMTKFQKNQQEMRLKWGSATLAVKHDTDIQAKENLIKALGSLDQAEYMVRALLCTVTVEDISYFQESYERYILNKS